MAPSESWNLCPHASEVWFCHSSLKRWNPFSHPVTLGWPCHLPWPKECGGTYGVQLLRPFHFVFFPPGILLPSCEESQLDRASQKKAPQAPPSSDPTLRPSRPSSSLQLWPQTQLKSAHPPSQPMEEWQIINCWVFKPLNFRVVCYTATDHYTWRVSDFI